MEFNINAIKEVYDKSPFAFCIVKAVFKKPGIIQDFIFEYANQALTDLNGISIDILKENSFKSMFPKNNKCFDLYCDTALKGTQQITSDYVPEIKKYIQIQCYQIAYGYCGCMISDISKEKELELSLFETKKIQVTDSKRLYNNIPGGVFQCMFNKQWTIVKC